MASRVGDRPGRRREDARQRRQQRRLPAPARAEEDHERAVGACEVELVERPHDVVARGVLDGEVRDDEIGGLRRFAHHGPPNARAGSTFTARRRPARLASRPTTIAMTNRHDERARRDLDGKREHRREQRSRCTAASDGGRDRQDHRLEREAAAERAVRRAGRLEHGEVAGPLHRRQVDDRADDAGGDDPQQDAARSRSTGAAFCSGRRSRPRASSSVMHSQAVDRAPSACPSRRWRWRSAAAEQRAARRRAR